jgi:GT2 family glycosyltransferase
MKQISVVVTNWNGKEILEKSLPIILENSKEAQEVIVVDDYSTDTSLAYLKQMQKKHKNLILVCQTENKGFANTSNLGVKVSKGEFVVLLNSDIHPHPNYIKSSMHHFSDPKVFGVGFAEIGNENYPRIYWSEGYLQYEPVFSKQSHITAWLSGGSSIIRKKYFELLNGFDEVYHPFYSEDLDLGYRAWKSGYRLIWEPTALVEHKHESTTSKFSKHFTDYVKERHRLLAIWRNITDDSLIKSNRVGMIFRILLGPNYIKIINAARKQVAKYPKQVVFPKLTDRDIFRLFQKNE